MAPPIDPELKSLKEKRSNAKRRVTITSNRQFREKLDNVIQSGPITAMEYDDALKMLVLHEQKDLEVKKFQGFDIGYDTWKILQSSCLYEYAICGTLLLGTT